MIPVLPMTTHVEPRGAVLATLVAASVLVLCRSLCWLVFADVSLDSDEAITGLMAKHLIEGRAFPLFYYGQGYLLAIESWLAAPVFAVFGASALALRVTVFVLNLVLAAGLLLTLARSVGLAPWAAFLAASFVLIPAPGASGMLMHANGMSPEPFIAIVALWVLRRRPAAFGLVFALGFMNREFVGYGLVSLLAIELADGTLLRREGLKTRLASLVVSAAVWDLVQALRAYSSTMGPGSPPDPDLAASTSLTQALGFVTLAPARIAIRYRRHPVLRSVGLAHQELLRHRD